MCAMYYTRVIMVLFIKKNNCINLCRNSPQCWIDIRKNIRTSVSYFMISGGTEEEELMEANKEQGLAEIRKKLKELLVINLNLEDIKPEEIKDDEILFGEGLGLDSLDAVEIVVLLQRNFNLDVKNMTEGKKIFYSVDTLARYILENSKK